MLFDQFIFLITEQPHKGDLEVDEIPVARLDLPVSLRVSGMYCAASSSSGVLLQVSAES